MRIPALTFPSAFLLLFYASAVAQETTPATKPSGTPPIKLNFLNVCAPTEAEKGELSAALNKIPAKVNYSGDFEVTRGRAVTDKGDASRYVRLRRELTGDPVFSNIQYSLSADDKNTTETLVFKVKDPKEFLLISLEDQISATAAKPASVLDADTPTTHIKLERYGKTSIALARCEERDQSAYEALFAQASKQMALYRKALGLRTMFRGELSWLSTSPAPPTQAKDKPAKAQPKATVPETNSKGKHLN